MGENGDVVIVGLKAVRLGCLPLRNWAGLPPITMPKAPSSQFPVSSTSHQLPITSNSGPEKDINRYSME